MGLSEIEAGRALVLFNKQKPEILEHWAKIIEYPNYEFSLVRAERSMNRSPEFISSLKAKNIIQCFNQDAPTLGTLKLYQGEAITNAVLHILLSEVKDFFNVGNTFNSQQLTITRELIYKEYHYLKISEIKYCFRMGMAGNFGDLYGRLDGQIVMNWLKEYDKERTVFRGNLTLERIKEAQEEKTENKFLSDKIMEEIKKLGARLYQKELEQKTQQLSIFQYKSLGQYFTAHGKNAGNEIEALRKKALKEYQSNAEYEAYSFDLFFNLKKSELLSEINSTRITIEKTSEDISI